MVLLQTIVLPPFPTEEPPARADLARRRTAVVATNFDFIENFRENFILSSF